MTSTPRILLCICLAWAMLCQIFFPSIPLESDEKEGNISLLPTTSGNTLEPTLQLNAAVRRKVTPLPPTVKKFSFYVDQAKETNEELAPLMERQLANGHQEAKHMNEAHFIWRRNRKGKGQKFFMKLKPWQRHNHFPGTPLWDKKSTFAEGMARYCTKTQQNKETTNHCTQPYLPHTFLLHKRDHVRAFLDLMQHAPPKAFLMKASAVNSGQGITVIGPYSQELKALQNTLTDSPENKYTEKGEYILQEYICNGLLYQNKFKFDLRFYWFVASIDPLIVLFRDGFGRVAGVEYTETDFGNFSAHITNTSKGAKAVSWDDVQKVIWDHYNAHKEELTDRLGKELDPILHVRNQMKAILVDMINAFRETSFSLESLLTSDNAFAYLALDLYVDNDLDVFLIEPQSSCQMSYGDGDPLQVQEAKKKFQMDFLDVAMEVTEKQQIQGQKSILPLENMGDFELVYDTESQPNFQFSYEYQRPSHKKGCEIAS